MTRLFIFGVAFALALPPASFAQRAESPPRWTISPRTGPASEGWPRDPVPRFSIPPRGTVALPQIGLPLPPHGLQSPAADRYGRGRRRHGPVTSWPVVYFVPQYVAPIPIFPEPAPIDVAPEAPAATGRLILDLNEQARNAQVFVDGYYAGMPEDFDAARGGGVLEAGPHRIDVTAPGLDALTFDVRVAPNQSVTYRGTLKPAPQPQKEPGEPTIFYLIPGCYMGNVHPKDARLPATCDLSRVVEFQY